MDQAETRSRCARVQALLGEAKLDGLIVAGRGLIAQHGSLRYLTGYCPVIRPGYAFLPPSGDPVAVVTTQSDIWLARRDGVEIDMRLAAVEGGEPSGIGAALSRLIAEQGRAHPRVGVAGLEDSIAADEFNRWGMLMPGVTFVPASDLVAAVKAVKTPEELAGMRAAAAMVDEGLLALVQALRTGATLRQAAGAAEALLRGAGAHEVLVYISTYPHFLHRPTDEVPAPGSLVPAFVEASNADGYWVEIARLIAIGTLDAAHSEIAALSERAMACAQAALRAGSTAGAAYAEIEQPILAAGLVSGLWFGHGIGVDHDLPVIGRDLPTKIVPNMVIALHPHVVDPVRDIGACLCDSFVIGPDGALPLSRLPRDLISFAIT